MQAIETRYKGPTGSRGARIFARASAGRLSVPWDYNLGIAENHAAAADRFKRKYGWKGRTCSGALPAGSYAHVFAGSSHGSILRKRKRRMTRTLRRR